MKLFTLLFTLLFIAGCDMPPDASRKVINQCKRQQLFEACLTKLPAGPASTQYNDWNEVVDSCASTAYYQALEARAGRPDGGCFLSAY